MALCPDGNFFPPVLPAAGGVFPAGKGAFVSIAPESGRPVHFFRQAVMGNGYDGQKTAEKRSQADYFRFFRRVCLRKSAGKIKQQKQAGRIGQQVGCGVNVNICRIKRHRRKKAGNDGVFKRQPTGSQNGRPAVNKNQRKQNAGYGKVEFIFHLYRPLAKIKPRQNRSRDSFFVPTDRDRHS